MSTIHKYNTIHKYTEFITSETLTVDLDGRVRRVGPPFLCYKSKEIQRRMGTFLSNQQVVCVRSECGTFKWVTERSGNESAALNQP